MLDAVARDPFADPGYEAARLVAPIDEREALRRDRQDVSVGVGASRGFDGPVGGLFELAEANVGDGAAREHRELEGIEGAQRARVVRRVDGGSRIAALAVDEAERVVAEREVRAELDTALELGERLLLDATQPERTPERSMSRRITVVRSDAAPRRVERKLDLPLAIRGEIEERVLEMREGEPRVRARKGGIEPDRALK